MNTIIRKAELKDAENLTVLKQQVWIATYAVEGIRTEFSSYVLSAFTTENIKKTMLDSDYVTLVAEIDNHIIGCVEVKLHPEVVIIAVKDLPEITVLYVLERFCGLGIGQKLMNAAFDVVKEKGFTSTWLSVLYSNERALNFYRKNYFEDVDKIYFEMGGNRYENRVMLRNLC